MGACSRQAQRSGSRLMPDSATPRAIRTAGPATSPPRAVGPRAVGPRAVGPPSVGPPSVADVSWMAGITLVKAAIVALAADAFLNSNEPRFSGKAMKIRAVGYAASLFLVPTVWRLRGRREDYPRELDLAVALPLLADAGGNAVGIYQRAHVDDAIHFANGALLSSVIGALASARTRSAWEAAAFAGAAGNGGPGGGGGLRGGGGEA